MSAFGGSYLPGEWSRPTDGHGFEDFFSEDIQSRGLEMLESDDMQRLLKTFNMGIGSTFGHSDEACFSDNAPYEHQLGQTYGQERGRTSGKAVVVWLKVKAALRWGIFIRKKAAERRAQLVELVD
ncbi:Calmodulin-binding protein 60 E [Camellia lanceoleosa]|uniref:Calmodulin-binding protein 60 E n=1 Tax=Camellia lanceoleosa TaxID=1840588 RepID=A0ACC0I4P7_9ERIC|nr:Calmodulin-binding protein 60 E [Camellia lanceoleosa]